MSAPGIPDRGAIPWTQCLSTVLCSPTKRFCIRPSCNIVCRRVQNDLAVNVNVRVTRAATQQRGVILLFLMYDRIRADPVLYGHTGRSDFIRRPIAVLVVSPLVFLSLRPRFASCPTRSDLLPTGGVSREYSILNFDSLHFFKFYFFLRFCQLITVHQHSHKRKHWPMRREKKAFHSAFFGQTTAGRLYTAENNVHYFYFRELASWFFYRSDERFACGVVLVNRRGNCGRRVENFPFENRAFPPVRVRVVRPTTTSVDEITVKTERVLSITESETRCGPRVRSGVCI